MCEIILPSPSAGAASSFFACSPSVKMTDILANKIYHTEHINNIR